VGHAGHTARKQEEQGKFTKKNALSSDRGQGLRKASYFRIKKHPYLVAEVYEPWGMCPDRAWQVS